VKRLISEPLVQFLLLGLAFYVLINLVAPEKLGLDAANDAYQITLDDETLLSYLQFQRKSFDAQKSSTLFDSLSKEQKSTLIDSYVRDEALYREALALGLDKQDDIIKRRLIQKMEYIAQGFYNDIKKISESELESFFQENIKQYEVSASVSFTHVFIANGTDIDDEGLVASAKTLLSELNSKAVVFEAAGQYGDRFLYNLNYLERTPDYIESHFGKNFQQSVFKLETSGQWHGPIKSEHGYHLVLVSNTAPSRTPALKEVAENVLADAQREQQRKIKVNAIAEIVSKYH
jgi:peptidyl-prolyl cis-trans isomerase C